jgi:ribosomal protein S27AE
MNLTTDPYLTSVVAANVPCFGYIKAGQKECSTCLLKEACAAQQPLLIEIIEEQKQYEYQPDLLDMISEKNTNCSKCGTEIKVSDPCYFDVLAEDIDSYICKNCGSSH